MECFLTGDGKGMCTPNLNAVVGIVTRHSRILEVTTSVRSDFVISIRWGLFLRFIPPTRRVGDMVQCCCRTVSAIFKRLCSDGWIP